MKLSPLSTWLGRSGAWALSLAIHAALLAWLLAATLAVTTAPPPPAVALELVRLPPPPPPPPPPQEARVEPRKTPIASTPKRPSAPMPLRTIQPAAPVAVAPPAHGFAQRQDDWAAPGPVAATGGGTSARRAPPGYADEVKARIVAKLEYPANHFTKVKDRAGNIVIIRRECSIPYEITVDRQGRMISYQIESCGDGVLDAAAEAALLKAGPFPPPPDTGAAEYVIYGSANLFVDSYGAKSGVRR